MDKKLISIFTPVFNEEKNLQEIYRQVNEVMLKYRDRYDYEHVFSDNCSTDDTPRLLKELGSKDSRVKIILLSKNFGSTRSTLNGLFRCSGDAVVQIDADLQDPPEMIGKFIEKWEAGFKIVYGVRKKRDEFWGMRLMRYLFYRIADMASNESLIPDVGEFRLMDKRILEELKKIRDYNPYLRGIIANMGFDQTGIPYHRRQRNRGKTSTNLFRLLDYGLNGIISHSTILLRLSSIAGFLIALISFTLIAVHLFLKIIIQNTVPGLTTLIILILFFLGVQMIFLGIIGEYLGKVYNQSIEKPLVIEKEVIGF